MDAPVFVTRGAVGRWDIHALDPKDLLLGTIAPGVSATVTNRSQSLGHSANSPHDLHGHRRLFSEWEATWSPAPLGSRCAYPR
jgi:hypothetical protein